MTLSDPLADLLTRIRNAGKAKFSNVDIPGSKVKIEICKILKDNGFIRNYKVIKDSKQNVIRVYLKYDALQNHCVLGLNRVSKPSRRVYVGAKDIKPVLNGLGIAIISTSRGILTDQAARQQNIGGEVLCNVW